MQLKGRSMRHISVLVFALIAVACVVVLMPFAPGRADGEGGSPIFGVTIPDGDRQWEMVRDEKIRLDGRLGVPSVHRRQAGGRGAA
jgi:hypothetical protein